MGQGNAIAHLMPPPFFAYRYVVAKARAPEESIQDMIDTCSPVADADNRYKIEVMPGVYAEEITMAPYVDVVAPYGRAVIRPPVSVSTAVTMDSNCMLQGLQVDMQSMAATAIGVDFGAKTNCSIEDCWITGGGATDIGVLDASTGNTVIIRRCRIDGAATGYKKTGIGTTWFYDNRVTGPLSLRSVQGAVADDEGVQTDETTEANDDTANDMDLLPTDPNINDAYYFGGVWPFQQLSLNIGTAGVKGARGWTITWEYYDRETLGWATLTVTDNTSEFTVAGTNSVTFTPPATWASTDVSGITAYWIRARVSAIVDPGEPITTQPLGTQAWVTDAIDIDVDAGILNLIENELMYEDTGANVDVAAAVISINSFGNTLAGDGWRIADSANISILSHDDVFSKVTFAGANGFFADLTGAKLYDCVTDALAIGDWVYCDSDDHVALADADDITKLPCIGRVAYLPTTSTCYVTNYGYAYDAAANSGHGDAWVAGKEFWVSGTPGEITTTMPAVFPQMVGVAVSTQRFKIDLGDVLGWVHTNEYLNASGVVSVDDWVYITATNDTVGLAKADAAVTMPAIGVVVEVIDLTHCRVKMRGKWEESNTDEGWVASDDLYISPATAGAITRVEPVMDIVQKVAEVKSFDISALIYEIAD